MGRLFFVKSHRGALFGGPLRGISILFKVKMGYEYAYNREVPISYSWEPHGALYPFLGDGLPYKAANPKRTPCTVVPGLPSTLKHIW